MHWLTWDSPIDQVLVAGVLFIIAMVVAMKTFQATWDYVVSLKKA
jgi:hypothetical protein